MNLVPVFINALPDTVKGILISEPCKSDMGGYSVYASCLDGSDPCVRLDGYMFDEHGGENGWKIEVY